MAKLRVEGQGSELLTKDIEMFSDGFIEVNNQNGDFLLKGLNSKLINESIVIIANSIDGNFELILVEDFSHERDEIINFYQSIKKRVPNTKIFNFDRN